MPKRHARARAASGLIAAVCLSLLVAGCGSSSSEKSAASTTLTVNWFTGTGTLDPAMACAEDDRSLVHNLYSTLVRFGEGETDGIVTRMDNAKIEPELAKSWTVSDDGLVYTFSLVEGAKFPDGSPLDAEAVKYSFERTMGLGSCAAYLIQASNFDLIKSVEATDPTTVTVTLARPSADLLVAFASPSASIVNPKQVEANGGDDGKKSNEWLATHAAGSGAYVLESYEPNRKAVLTTNAAYVGPKPHMEKVVVNYITSAPTLQLQAKSGQADVTLGLSPQNVADLSKDGCCQLANVPSPRNAQISMSNSTAPLNDVNLRKALILAVPYEDMLEQVAHGYGSLYFGPLPPGIPGYSEKSTPIEQDVAEAKKIVDGLSLKKPIKLEMIVPSTSTIATDAATVVKAAWAEIGVDVTLTQLSAGDFATRYTGGDYQVASNVDALKLSAGFSLPLVAACKNPFNNAHVCIPGVDEVIEKGRTTMDPAEAQPIWDQVTEAWRADWPRLIVFQVNDTSILSKKVTRFTSGLNRDFASWQVK